MARRKFTKPTPPSFLEDVIAGLKGVAATPSDLDVLAARVAATPADEALKLVYADCLDEHDRGDEAAMIRADVVIRQAARTKMMELDAECDRLRPLTIAAYRAAAVEGVAPDSPAYTVCDLVARSMVREIRDDGCLKFTIPVPVQQVIARAANAGVLPRGDFGICIGAMTVSSSDFSFISVGNVAYAARVAEEKACACAHAFRKQNRESL